MANLLTQMGLKCTVLGGIHNKISSFALIDTSSRCKLPLRHPSIRPKQALVRHESCSPSALPMASSKVANETQEEESWSPETYQALLRGGEDVTSVMKTMTEVLEDIDGLDPEDERVALELAAAGAVQQKLDELDGSFLLALDWMIKEASSEQDEKRQEVLEVIKETVLGQLSQKCPNHVQIIGMLCRTPTKEKRLEVLRRSAGGGGVFDTESGGKLTIPGANLNDISTQADNLINGIEEKHRVKDRRLLAKLVVIREEARSMLGGGLLDKRNDNRGLKNLPGNLVTFLSKIVSVRPGPALKVQLSNVMKGMDEGKDPRVDDAKHNVSAKSGKKELPIRPGLFMDGVTKVLGGMYETNTAGVGVQQLEWIHRETLKILEEIGFA